MWLIPDGLIQVLDYPFDSLEEREMTGICRLFDAVEMLRKQVKKDMPSQHIALLLTVSQHPGATMSELCELLEMPQGTLSRNVKALSSYVDRGDSFARVEGLGLLYTERDQTRCNLRLVYLTAKGRSVVDELATLLSTDLPAQGQPGADAGDADFHTGQVATG